MISPPPFSGVQDWPPEGACPWAFAGWQGEVLQSETVGEAEEFFAQVCYGVDMVLTEWGGCRHFLNFWDDTSRDEARRLLLPEVELALTGRDQA